MPPLDLAQYEALWAISEIPMALVDLDDRFVRCNRAFCGIVGYAQHELRLRTWKQITHPDDLEGDIASVESLRADNESDGYGLTKRYITKDGRIIFVRLSVLPVRDDKGNCVGFFVSALPILAEYATGKAVEKFSLIEWITKNKKDAAIVTLGGGLFLGRDTIIELLKLWLEK